VLGTYAVVYCHPFETSMAVFGSESGKPAETVDALAMIGSVAAQASRSVKKVVYSLLLLGIG
jgi:hypothetical protein